MALFEYNKEIQQCDNWFERKDMQIMRKYDDLYVAKFMNSWYRKNTRYDKKKQGFRRLMTA